MVSSVNNCELKGVRPMLALMAAMVLIALIVGPTLLTGQPMLLVIGIVLAGAVLLVTRRRSTLTGRR